MKTIYIPKGETVRYESVVTENLVVKGCLEVAYGVSAKHISGSGIIHAQSISADTIRADELEAGIITCKRLIAKRVSAPEVFASESAAVSYESLVSQLEEARVRDHDLRHHIAALSGLCAQGELEKAQEYLKSILGALPERLPEHYCKVGALNALLGHFASQCREGGIRFRYEISLPERLEVGPLSLCVIFGNALQNAVEACLAVEDAAQRFLSLKAAPAQGRLAIELSNGCSQAPCGDGTGGYQSTKAEPGHGLGLGSIRATVERYHGWCDTSYENGVFTLRVLL